MDIAIGSSDKQSEMVTIPASCIDATKYKVGQSISYKVQGKVKKIDADYGVTIELNPDDEEEVDEDEFDDMDSETQDKHIEKAFKKTSKKLEEYR